MAKIKYTKNELKTQRDALRRYTRYLPTLQLKKQQLQIEIRNVEHQMDSKNSDIARFDEQLKPWISLFASISDFIHYIQLDSVLSRNENIAGVDIPVIDEISFKKTTPDLHSTPAWIDEGIEALESATRLQLELRYLQEAHLLLREELRITAQRVNLFEKVKIPEAQENIRVIRIFLGDEQTAGVARAKIAKSKNLRLLEAR